MESSSWGPSTGLLEQVIKEPTEDVSTSTNFCSLQVWLMENWACCHERRELKVRWNGVVVDDFTQMRRISWSLIEIGTWVRRTWSLRFGMSESELEVLICLFHGIPNGIHYLLKNRIVWVVCSQRFTWYIITISESTPRSSQGGTHRYIMASLTNPHQSYPPTETKV